MPHSSIHLQATHCISAAFDQQLSLADEGYESGSDTADLPTPLRKTPRIQNISSMEHTSFDPVPVTPCSTPQTPPRPVCRCLSFSSADSYTPDSTPECSEEEEEDFQMVSLDNEHWTSEETPERTLCIHEHGLPHGLCPYPCPYANYQMPSYMDSLDLSDISDYEDYMVTSSDEDTSIQGYTLLRDALVWFEVNMIHWISSITDYIEYFLVHWTLKFPLGDIVHIIYYSINPFLYPINLHCNTSYHYFLCHIHVDTLPCKILSKQCAAIQN